MLPSRATVESVLGKRRPGDVSAKSLQPSPRARARADADHSVQRIALVVGTQFLHRTRSRTLGRFPEQRCLLTRALPERDHTLYRRSMMDPEFVEFVFGFSDQFGLFIEITTAPEVAVDQRMDVPHHGLDFQIRQVASAVKRQRLAYGLKPGVTS